MLLLLLVAIVLPFSTSLVPKVHAYAPYSLTPVPATTAEGNVVSLNLADDGAVANIQYRFRFFVTDPASTTVQSIVENYTTVPGQYSFNMKVDYPSPAIRGSNSLPGQYNVKVDELWPTAAPGVAGASFSLTITDSSSYQRTQTVMITASGYNASESVTATIKTQTTSTMVFSALLAASSTGTVATSWKSPKNAVIDNYIVTLTGTTTIKKIPDSQEFSLGPAIMIIPTIASAKSSYQRTETMRFSFQPTYPDGSVPSTGSGLLTLTSPNGNNAALTTMYNSTSQTFVAFYTTLLGDQGGAWTASLTGHAYNDGLGNSGPGTTVAITSQVTPVPLTVIITANTNVTVGQQVKFNATITYPDGTIFQTGTVKAYLVYNGPPAINDTISVAFDGVKQWLGTYTVQPGDNGGQWSLVVRASDSPTPPNSGSIARAITIQNSTSGPTSGPSSFPLYYFGIIAGLLAIVAASIFLVFRRRRVTQTSLKIDLGAVQSEAGRIESTDFFKSVKDQVKEKKNEK